MNRNYYTRLKDKYFDASLTAGEERRLRRFLSRTDDPEFDDIKAVAGYFAVGRSFQERTPRNVRFPWIGAVATAVAASIVVVSVYAAQVQKNHRADAIASMENTLVAIFSAGTDIENELSDILNR